MGRCVKRLQIINQATFYALELQLSKVVTQHVLTSVKKKQQQKDDVISPGLQHRKRRCTILANRWSCCSIFSMPFFFSFFLNFKQKKKIPFICTVGGTIKLVAEVNVDVCVCQYENSAASPEHRRLLRGRAGEESPDAVEQKIPQGAAHLLANR